MGCCYSIFCKDDNSSQNGEPDERSHLLSNPVSNINYAQRESSEDLLSRHLNDLPKKTDEQSALNRILQETATNVIDVAALDSHNLQQHEYLERMKLYNAKVQQICLTNKNQIVNKFKNSVLQDIALPDAVLSSESISSEHANLITYAVSEAVSAINDIKVEHKEDLVVPLRITC